MRRPCPARRRTQRSNARAPFFLGLVLLALCGTAPLLACYEPGYRTVHFTDWRWPRPKFGRPDFFRMPQPWRGVPTETRALPAEDVTVEAKAPGEKDQADPAEQAVQWETAGRFREAAAAWARVLREDEEDAGEPVSWDDGEPDYSDDLSQMQGLEDRLAALQAWRGPQDSESLRLYLRARDLVNVQLYTDAKRLLAQLTREPYRTHAEYVRACIVFYSGTPEASAAAFRAVVRRHPGHQRALYMVGRSYFRPAYFFRLDRIEKGSSASNISRNLRYLRQARSAYDACAALTPRTSLTDGARGMAAACCFRLGEYPKALLRYCRQLADLPPGSDNRAAFLSARMCLQRMSLADHRAFQARAVTRPEIASVYLDLHLHYGQPGARTTYNLGLFALEVLKRRPAAPLSGRLLARLALIEGRLGHWERAERLAAAALARCAPGAYRDQASWQHALALRQLGWRREALAEYERLAADAVVPKMRRGAHEAAAVLSEEIGDRPNAIRHYFALEYQLDYGYLIDCLATQDELRAFLKRFPGHPRARLVRYSLGFRQLRAGRYDAATRTFASLGSWLDVAEKKYDCATSKKKPRWPPLQTARFMSDAVRREAAARTSAEKARAAYSRASLLFHQRYLVLYNGALWMGRRTYAFDIQSPDNVSREPNPPDTREQRAFDRYQEEHAALYQAIRIFERIANQYPKTPEAPKALYSAAMCYDFLPGVERYWRDREASYNDRAIQLYHRLQRKYPDDPLAVAAVKYGGPLPKPVLRRNHPARRRDG
jgi:TolA-binding protein